MLRRVWPVLLLIGCSSSTSSPNPKADAVAEDAADSAAVSDARTDTTSGDVAECRATLPGSGPFPIDRATAFGGTHGWFAHTENTDWAILIPEPYPLVFRLTETGTELFSRLYSAGLDVPSGGIGVDATGAIYHSGFFKFAATINGATVLNDAPTTSDGPYRGIFVHKFSNTGERVATFQFESTTQRLSVLATRIAVRTTGETWLAAEFEGTVNVSGTALTSAGRTDMQLLALDASGVPRVTKRFGSSAKDTPTAIAALPDGGVVVAGVCGAGTDFGGGPTTATRAMFIAAFDVSGAHRWSKTFPIGDTDESSNIFQLEADANLILATVRTSSAVDFGTGSLPAGAAIVGLSLTGTPAFGVTTPRARSARLFAKGIAIAGQSDPMKPQTIDYGGGPLSTGPGREPFFVVLDRAGKHVASRWVKGCVPDSGINPEAAVDKEGRAHFYVWLSGGKLDLPGLATAEPLGSGGHMLRLNY